ncbi:hypothetical protein [Nitrososphaera sp.]|uniref:hypothetical protein n=1 Tax=Nitrososphaera sp. TaxID=1971748 RepID=UPI00307E25D2
MHGDLQRLLIQKGYAPLDVRGRVVSHAALSSLAVLGQPSAHVLLYHMSCDSGMQERDLLASRAEFEKGLQSMLGLGADIILKEFWDRIRRLTSTADLGIDETLDAIGKDGAVAFARTLDYGDHALVIYRTHSFLEKMLAGFFDPLYTGGDDDDGSSNIREARAVVVDDGIKLVLTPVVAATTATTITTTYQQLCKRYGTAEIGEGIGRWTQELRQGGKGPVRLRIAKDDTWLAQRGLAADQGMEKQPWTDAAVVCALDAGRADLEYAFKLAELHRFVVFEGEEKEEENEEGSASPSIVFARSLPP